MKDRQPGRIETGTMQRRKYLCEMAVNWALAILGALLAQGLGGLLFLYAILIPKSSMLGTAWALIAGVAACYASGAWIFCSSLERSKSLRYFPPIREQIAALPADEVLLRGAEPPETWADELIRPASYREEMPARMLLRPDQHS